ncbi:hypothetical protein Tco_0846155 [Tanacetum coccineum]
MSSSNHSLICASICYSRSNCGPLDDDAPCSGTAYSMSVCSKLEALKHLDGIWRKSRDLDSIWEETDEITTLHEFQYLKSIQWLEMASQFLVTASRGSSDGVRILVTTLKVADSKETLSRFAG